MRRRSSGLLLAVLAVLFVNAVFVAAMVRNEFDDPQLPLCYVSVLLLYAALYLRCRLPVPVRGRRHQQEHAVLRRGLGYAAAGLAAFLSALFFYITLSAPGNPLPLAVGGWLLLAAAACCLYRIMVLHVEEEEEDEDAAAPQGMQALQVHATRVHV